jgi:type VI secretion system protein ImpG
MKRDQLLIYYEQELRFIRKLASGFADKYPEVASRLLLEPTKCDDPHVERLIEAFAMLTARVHLRLDDDFSEVSDALLGILQPHYLSPIPSMTVVQLTVDPDAGAIPGGFRVDRGSLLHSRPVKGVRCGFRTAYPLRLFPIEVTDVEVGSATAFGARVPPEMMSALRIGLRTIGGVPFSELAIDSLRFFLDAGSGSIHSLYELFLRDPRGLMVRADADSPSALLPADRIRPVGFGREEGLLEYPAESFLGYRLLQEYFSFPEKFLFVEFAALEKQTREIEGDRMELLVFLAQPAAQIDVRVEPQNLKLGCTPAVNLFPHTADPIRLTHTAVEYPVVPDARSPSSYEVHSIREVTSVAVGTAETRSYASFFGVRHPSAGVGENAFWHAMRRPSMRKGDPGTDVFLSLVDANFDPLKVPIESLHVETLCTNRDLPSRLTFGDPKGDFQLEGRPGVSKIVALRKPTDSLPPPIGEGSRWRLVSHLSLNHLSITDAMGRGGSDAGDGRALATLQEILRLYDFADSPVTRQRIAGLVGLRSRPVVRRVGRGSNASFVRGLEAVLEFDPTQYTGSGLFLFASVLERFLGLYTSVNSFSQTVAVVRQRPGELKRWAPRAGEIQLL